VRRREGVECLGFCGQHCDEMLVALGGGAARFGESLKLIFSRAA
jgi:hypothetical protein